MAVERKGKQLYSVYQSKNVLLLSSRKYKLLNSCFSREILKAQSQQSLLVLLEGGNVFCSLKRRHSENCMEFLCALGKAAKYRQVGSKEGQDHLEWEEEQHCSGRGTVNFHVNSVRRFFTVCCIRQTTDLLLLQKLTHTEQHLGLALAQEDKSCNNSVDGEGSQIRDSLWAVWGQPGLRLEAWFLIVFLQGNSHCRICYSCREQLCRRGCCSWEEVWRQTFFHEEMARAYVLCYQI